MGTHLDPLALGLATAAAFLLSGAYYGLLGGKLARLSAVYAEAGPMTPTTVLLELLRTVVVAVVIAGLVGWSGIAGLGAALLLASMLWVAFPMMLLSGSVLHERVPVLLAAIHSGDWLVKLTVITAVVTVYP